MCIRHIYIYAYIIYIGQPRHGRRQGQRPGPPATRLGRGHDAGRGHISISIYLSLSLSLSLYIYIYTYTYMCLCVYIYIYIHTHAGRGPCNGYRDLL